MATLNQLIDLPLVRVSYSHMARAMTAEMQADMLLLFNWMLEGIARQRR